MPGRHAPGTNNKEGRATHTLFEVAAAVQFDVSKDGRFLIQVPVEQGAMNVPLTLVMNSRGNWRNNIA
jgi:hypothetical protein